MKLLRPLSAFICTVIAASAAHAEERIDVLERLSPEMRAKIEASMAAIVPLSEDQLQFALNHAIEAQNAALSQLSKRETKRLAQMGTAFWSDCARLSEVNLRFIEVEDAPVEPRARAKALQRENETIRVALWDNGAAFLSAHENYKSNSDASAEDAIRAFEANPEDGSARLGVAARTLMCQTIVMRPDHPNAGLLKTTMADPLKAGREQEKASREDAEAATGEAEDSIP